MNPVKNNYILTSVGILDSMMIVSLVAIVCSGYSGWRGRRRLSGELSSGPQEFGQYPARETDAFLT